MPSGVGGERVYGTGEKLSIGIACCSVDWIRGIDKSGLEEPSGP